MCLNNFGPIHATKPTSADASTYAIDTNSHSCSQHIQWVQPGQPTGVPTTMPDHVQCSPSELYIRVSQGMLHNKLPKENGSRVVQARHTRGQPISGPGMEIQLDRIHQRALYPFWTCQSNRYGGGRTPTPNNVKQSLPLQILSKVQHTSIKGRMGSCSVMLPVLQWPTRATEGPDCTPQKTQYPLRTSTGNNTSRQPVLGASG